MADGNTEVRGRPVGGRGRVALRLAWTIASLTALGALGLAFWGWVRQTDPKTWDDWVDVTVRTVKVLLLSDIYFDADHVSQTPMWQFEWSRALGVVASVIIATRLILLGIGTRFSEWWYRFWIGRHDVIVGDGPAAREYAGAHNQMFAKRKAIHLAAEEQPGAHRLATYERRGPLKSQLQRAAGRKARRIVVDEGDDADTWQTAQAAARRYPKAEVMAHIADPWMRDRLSRERSAPKLTTFSYSGGAARQVMLAHPPFLLARNLAAPVQHILLVGFGQVGQELAREFIVTCVMPGERKLMITIIDPAAERTLAPDFIGRHEELMKHVDFRFISGDIRLEQDKVAEKLKERTEASPVCAAYVAIDQDARPLALAFALRAAALRHRLFVAPIFLCAQHGAGLPPVRHGSGIVGGDESLQEEREKQAIAQGQLCNLRVVSFGAWPAAFDGAGLLERRQDMLARRYHEEHERLRADRERRDIGAVSQGQTAWNDLSDQARVSVRRAVAHVRAKAHVAGFDLDRWLSAATTRATHDVPPGHNDIRLDDADQGALMARLEHQRWMLDRFLDDWRPGKRSDYHRTRPGLTAFDKLDPSERDKDASVAATAKTIMKEWNGKKKPR